MIRPRRLLVALVAVSLLVGVLAAAASAHARVSPAVSLSGQLQLYSLAVPTEASAALTTKVVLTLPRNFSIDSFAPSPGWHRVLQQTGRGENSVIQRVIWSGGHIPSGEDAVFQFLAEPAAPGTYTFTVQQTYSDGRVVNWSGPESSDAPAPVIQAVRSLGGSGGGGSSTLAIIALVVGGVGLLVGALALMAAAGGAGHPGGRPLA